MTCSAGSGVFPSSNDFTSVVLPGVVNVPGTTAIQPTFRDEGLYFTQDTSIAFAAYAGSHDAAALGFGGNWSAPVTLLQAGRALGTFGTQAQGGALATTEAGSVRVREMIDQLDGSVVSIE